jgi:hypothetical protein
LEQIAREQSKKQKEFENQKNLILKKIEGSLDENERRRLLEQYEQLKLSIEEQQRREAEQ